MAGSGRRRRRQAGRAVLIDIGGGAGAMAGAPMARVIGRHGKRARQLFAVMVIAEAGCVAWRALST